MRSFNLLGIVLTGLLVYGCGGPEPTKPTPLLQGKTCAANSTLTYENFGKAYFLTWCNGCHSSSLENKDRADAPNNVNFDTLQDIRKHANRIYKRSVEGDNTMPPSIVLSHEQKKLLGEWLSCGAPSNKGSLP